MKINLKEQFDTERKKRIRDEIGLNGSTELNFRTAVAHKFPVAENSLVMDALQFSKSIEYSHPGLSKEAYLNHPLRVATLIVNNSPLLTYEATIAGLLHNVLEVSNVTVNDLNDRYGARISSAIELLTIDRQAEGEEYLKKYYNNIKNGPANCGIVKVLDKLDNVYMICFNPSDRIRSLYLDEIENMVLPLAKKVLPKLHEYFWNLAIYMREIGYLDKK